MEKNKTNISMNKKIWYRLLKVLFIISILVTIFFVNRDLVLKGTRTINNNKTTITCKTIINKNTYVASDLKIKLKMYQFTNSGEFIDENNKILKTCGGFTQSPYNLGRTYLTIPNDFFDITPVYSYTSFIKNLFLYNLLIILFAEILKRIFYYIILGTFKNKNNL